MKNFIFVSPHFPVNYRNFCIKLHENGVNVLGIGDAPYDSLDYMLQGALTEYYRVNNMENYDEISASSTERSTDLRATTSTGLNRTRGSGLTSTSPVLNRKRSPL